MAKIGPIFFIILPATNAEFHPASFLKALILRPDRFILSSLQKNSDINKFVNKSMLQFS